MTHARRHVHECRASHPQQSSVLLTLISTALRECLDVWAYLKDVLNKLVAGSTDCDSLRADIWNQLHPDSVRNYRPEERRDTANRTKLTHAQRQLQNARKNNSAK